MEKGETPGVEHRSPRERKARLVPATVDGVAHDRQADMGEMRADLVLPARVERDLEQARPREALADAESRAGRPRGLTRTGHPPSPADPGVPQRGVHDTPVLGGRARDEREVDPIDPVSAEGVDEAGAGLAGESEGEGARGV
jgi:hypothetical protein